MHDTTPKWVALLVATAMTAFGGNASAELEPGSAETATRVLSEMHHMNQMVIAAGKLAEEKATTDSVRDFGERLWRDHAFGDRRVTALADELGLTLQKPQPRTEEAKKRMQKAQHMMTRLQRISGPGFDGMYVEFMGDAHQHAVETLTSAREGTNIEPLAKLLGQMIPILEQHTTLARQLEAEKPWAPEEV